MSNIEGKSKFYGMICSFLSVLGSIFIVVACTQYRLGAEMVVQGKCVVMHSHIENTTVMLGPEHDESLEFRPVFCVDFYFEDELQFQHKMAYESLGQWYNYQDQAVDKLDDFIFNQEYTCVRGDNPVDYASDFNIDSADVIYLGETSFEIRKGFLSFLIIGIVIMAMSLCLLCYVVIKNRHNYRYTTF